MFAAHQPIISQWGRDRPENMAHIMRFVLLSIRQPLWRAAGDMSAHLAGEYIGNALWGYRAVGWHWLETNGEACAAQLETLWHGFPDPELAECEMLSYLAETVPGLGFAKAGFVLQLGYGISGCLDSHNLARFGISPTLFAHSKRAKRPETIRRRARAYGRTVTALGGCGGLWDSWCHYVAENQPARYENATAVSAHHCSAFGLA